MPSSVGIEWLNVSGVKPSNWKKSVCIFRREAAPQQNKRPVHKTRMMLVSAVSCFLFLNERKRAETSGPSFFCAAGRLVKNLDDGKRAVICIGAFAARAHLGNQ